MYEAQEENTSNPFPFGLVTSLFGKLRRSKGLFPQPTLGFRRPTLRPLREQLAYWKGSYPHLRLPEDGELPTDPVRGDEDGYLAWPKPAQVALPGALGRDPVHHVALMTMLERLGREREVANRLRGIVGRREPQLLDLTTPERLRLAPDAAAAYASHHGRYGDVYIAKVQLGRRYVAKSRPAALRPQEVGMDAYAALCLLMSHPWHLSNDDDLWMDCVGTECVHAFHPDVPPCLHLSWNGQLAVSWEWTGGASARAGACTMHFV